MNKKNTPVIISAVQFTQRKGTSKPLDSLSLMAKTSKEAIENTGTKNLVDIIDAIYMVNISSWLHITPKEKVYLPDGGQTPQMLVNRAAKAVASGEHRAVLITGGEAAYSINKTYNKERPQHWPEREDPKYVNGERWTITDMEIKYRLYIASLSYALFETALRGSSKRSIEEHRKYMGKLFAHFSEVASKNPYSWTQKRFNAEEILTPSPENRRIVYPYTKRMCANNLVDQAGSVITTSEEIAESLGIDKEQWVYIMGGATFWNVPDITRRPRLYDSPATREGVRLALEQAGLTLSDIDKFDLYSCFPSIVEIFMNELGIKEDDPRDLTVTGGLPFFGTPLSNYSLHAIINCVELIRKNPSLKLMVIANGGFNTKQSIGIYGTTPPAIQWSIRDDSKIQESIFKEILPEPVEKVNDMLRVDGYSIYYDRTGEPKRGFVIGTLENGARSLAIIKDDQNIFLKLETQELVGRNIKVKYDSEEERNIVVSLD
jgi:acetyl-CoA C-acetyltransferase